MQFLVSVLIKQRENNILTAQCFRLCGHHKTARNPAEFKSRIFTGIFLSLQQFLPGLTFLNALVTGRIAFDGARGVEPEGFYKAYSSSHNIKNKQKTNSVALSPRANYTD
jgi:hypothetical protein